MLQNRKRRSKSGQRMKQKGNIYKSRLLQSSTSWRQARKAGCLIVTVIAFFCWHGSKWLGNDRSTPIVPGFATLPSPWTQDDVNVLNQYLTKTDDILLWIHAHLRDNMVSVTSLGPSGLVILHRLHSLGLLKDVPVITVDTLHLFPESMEFILTMEKYYSNDMRLQVYRPKEYSSRDAFDEAFGKDFYKTHADEFGYYTKVEPMLRALQDKDAMAWITGRRRSQGGEREQLQAFELVKEDSAIPRLKINPLYNWSYDQVWNYLQQHKLPHNPLHDKGYKSIGDVMTTQAVDPGAPERSGRFVGLNRTECGLHSHLEKVQRLKAEAESRGEELESPKLVCDECIELNKDNFDDIVLKGPDSLLFEFYSPFCGACQEFAPTLHAIAKRLSEVTKIKTARFDVTTQPVPESGVKAGIDVDSTPQLFLILREPSFRVVPYEGDNEYDAIKSWINANGFTDF